MSSSHTSGSARRTTSPLKKPSDFQISLCIPSSVISDSNAANLEHITHIAYQIAKAATIYNVSEIVVLDIPSKKTREERTQRANDIQINLQGDSGNRKIKFGSSNDSQKQEKNQSAESTELSHIGKNENNALLLASFLQFFVTPKYLVRSVFRTNPYLKKFKYAEKLPKLSTLPFMNNNGVGNDFKEGFTVSKQAPKIRKKNKKVSAVKKLKVTKYVNVGDSKLLELSGPEVPTNVRVTVDVKNKRVVSPELAYGISGCKASFGYHVRLARTVTSVFTESSHADGYTESIFVNADNYFGGALETQIPKKENDWQGKILMVIGNLRDLDYIFKQEMIDGVDSITDMFDSELSVPSGLRIEDAALVCLAKV
ncbi:hypothetical protein JCM33374_g550 [Metschnikowia sp. JCM 33374]|nr:hypothetical protein JCM33374_g550 [Metschnikowia sp. JCM 33374]